MADIGSFWTAVAGMVLKPCYWFHYLSVNITPDGTTEIIKQISPGVLAFTILIVLIIVQINFPGVLQSLVNLIIQLIGAVAQLVNPGKREVNNTQEPEKHAKAFDPLYKTADVRQ